MTRPRYALARRRAQELLRKAHVSAPPVPVERLAEIAGAIVRYEPFEGALSGLLHRSADRSIIGINSLHPDVRQRFSIAHELGHLLLHEPQLQIDEHAFVAFRNPQSSEASNPAEIEANQFAAALLMPEPLLRRCALALGDNPDASEAIAVLAKQFHVSQDAMTIRLSSLGWLAQL